MKFAQLFLAISILSVTNILQSADDPSRCVIDQVPIEVAAHHIFGRVLAEEPSQARQLLRVSRCFLSVVNDPRTIKSAVSKRDRAFSSYEIARAMNTVAARYYVEVNGDLCHYGIDRKNIYFFTLKTNPYADVNYAPKPAICSSTMMATADSKLLIHCAFPNQDNWIIDLLKAGANPNDYYENRRRTPFFFFCTKALCYSEMPSEQVEILSQLLLHGANPNGIEGFRHPLNVAICNDNIVGAKKLMDFGGKLYEYEIHSYLHKKHLNQEKPSLDTLEFLLQHGCSPYLPMNYGPIGEEAISDAFYFVGTMHIDETMKDAIKNLFEKDSKEKIAKARARLKVTLQETNDRLINKKSDE